jgi:hypothetical protein
LGDLAVIGGAEAEEAEDAVEDMSYVNAGGVAGFMADAQDIAEFSEFQISGNVGTERAIESNFCRRFAF